jgi:hypothetical protein
MNQYERVEPQKVFDFQLDLVRSEEVEAEEFACVLSHTMAATGYYDCSTFFTIADALDNERESREGDWTDEEIFDWAEQATSNLATNFSRNWCAPHTLNGSSLDGEDMEEEMEEEVEDEAEEVEEEMEEEGSA